MIKHCWWILLLILALPLVSAEWVLVDDTATTFNSTLWAQNTHQTIINDGVYYLKGSADGGANNDAYGFSGQASNIVNVSDETIGVGLVGKASSTQTNRMTFCIGNGTMGGSNAGGGCFADNGYRFLKVNSGTGYQIYNLSGENLGTLLATGDVESLPTNYTDFNFTINRTSGNISWYVGGDLKVSVIDANLQFSEDYRFGTSNKLGSGSYTAFWFNGIYYEEPDPQDPFAHIQVFDLYDNTTLSGLTVELADGTTNTTDGSGIAYFYNKTGQSFTVDGGLNYFNGSGTAAENQTTQTSIFGARYNITAYESNGDPINSFSVESGIQTNTTSTGWLWLVLNPNTTNTVNFTAAGFENKTVNITTGSKDIGSFNTTLSYDTNLTVQALESTNLSATITGLCARVNGSSFTDSKCNATGDSVTWINEFPQGLYNITTYSVGVGDGSSASWTSNTTEFNVSGDTLAQLVSQPLTLEITFLDEENRTQLIGINITASVIASNGDTTDYVTDTGNLTISGDFVEGEYTLRYGADGYSLRDFFFTFDLDDPIQNETLYLLRQATYTPGIVEVRDFDGTTIQGATVIMERYYGNSSIPNKVQQGTTNEDGNVVFVAESITAFYTFQVNINGVIRFRDENPELLTVGTDGLWHKTIVLNKTGTDVIAANTGFTTAFSPQGTLFNGTEYNFTFSINTTDWDLNTCTFTLRYADNLSLISTTNGFCTSNNGTSTINYTPRTLDPLQLIATATTSEFTNTYQQFYTVNEPITSNFTLKDLADDLSGFGGSGFNNFTRFILAIIIMTVVLFTVAGTTNLINNPEEMLLLLFALSLIFSYIDWLNLGLSNMPVPAMNQWFLSTILGILTVVSGLRKTGGTT